MQITYKPARNLLQTIFHVEILQGLALTLRTLFSKPITLQYPQEMPNVRLGFRGQHALVRDEKTGESKCIGCMRCATVCPSRCIHIRYDKDEQSGSRTVTSYRIEALRCVYCGYCEEVCPVNALALTEIFEYAAYDRHSIDYDQNQLLDNWDRFCDLKGEAMRGYVNPFWRPRGLANRDLTVAKRLQVPTDWTLEGQVVGRKAVTSKPGFEKERT